MADMLKLFRRKHRQLRHIKVQSLKLRNFKGFAEFELDFDEQLTLLAGVNGVGKSSVIQGLLVAATRAWGCAYQYRFRPEQPAFELREDVVRVAGANTTVELTIAIPQETDLRLSWQWSEGEFQELYDRDALVPSFKKHQASLPLIVYYEQDRLSMAGVERYTYQSSDRDSRNSALNTTITSAREFTTWFFDKEADEGQEIRDRQDFGYEDEELSAIRQLLSSLDGLTGIRSRTSRKDGKRRLYVQKEGLEPPFESLSGGEQAFFLLAADLARRLAVMFPGTSLSDAPGLVCIDELELHLHPAWQRIILPTLTRTFPSCQFIVTTHSPPVMGSVAARHVRVLRVKEKGLRTVSRPMATKGRDSNFLLTGVLETDASDPVVSEYLYEFDKLVDAGKLEEAQKMLDELKDSVEGDSPELTIRQAKLNRLRRLQK